MLLTAVVFILILSILVLIHEAGHFFVAKKLGVKVEEFGFGFPPRLWGKKIGETIYSINWLPIGGFVKLFGEDEAGAGRLPVSGQKSLAKDQRLTADDQKRAFFARPWWQKASIVLAGVVMNFILATAIISYLFAVQGVATPGNRVEVVAVAPGSPAALAGLKVGDVILAVNGERVNKPEVLVNYTKAHLGKAAVVEVEDPKGGKVENVSIIPRKVYPANEGAMGVAIASNIINRKYPWYQAPFVGIRESLNTSWMIVQGLGSALVQGFTKREIPQGVAGPVGIAELTGQFVQLGPAAVLTLLAMLSLNLAILNVLPIPALDGGRLFFILIEGLIGRRVNPKYESYVHAAGMAFLLGLIVLITFHDILGLIVGRPIIPGQ